MKTTLLATALSLAIAGSSSAACVNRFVNRNERPRQVVTLLTGKLTFQEAQALAEAIGRKQSPAVEWLDASGKTLSRQFGDLKVVRPMPVGCDGKASGVVVIATFPGVNPPKGKMKVRFSPELVVDFEEQN